MGNFNINILHPVPDYNRLSSTFQIEACTEEVVSYNVGILNATGANFLSSYSGDNWNKLVITSVSHEDVGTDYEGVLKNNGTPITQSDCPYEIDISSVSTGNVIPNITYEVNRTSSTQTSNIPSTKSRFGFYIETVEGIRGKITNSLFQVYRNQCTTITNPSISNEVTTVNENGRQVKTFRITGSPSTTYTLKMVYDYSQRYGIVNATLQDTDSLNYFNNVLPSFPNDSSVIEYTTNGSGVINLQYELIAEESRLVDADTMQPVDNNCLRSRLILYKADGVTLNLSELVVMSACNNTVFLGDNDFFLDNGEFSIN